MNFLAHLYLAGKNEDLLIGNFIADAIKGNKFKTYPEGIGKGIMMHRAIDSFSDHNPVYLKSVHRLQPQYGKYSGVITDMFYDYFLANNWSKFSDQSLEGFKDETYRILDSRKVSMPEESRMILKYMKESDWLYSYKNIAGIRQSLAGMSKRMKYYFPMDKAASELEERSALYNNDFIEFFPLLIEYVAHFKIG